VTAKTVDAARIIAFIIIVLLLLEVRAPIGSVCGLAMGVILPEVLCRDFARASAEYCNLLQGGVGACQRLLP
jgi:hypothetical protein